MSVKGECKICGRHLSLFQDNTCKWCLTLLKSGKTVEEVEAEFINNPPVRGRKPGSAKVKIEAPPQQDNTQIKIGYPIKSMIYIYTTSDGREFGQEIDALRHELDICQQAIGRARR